VKRRLGLGLLLVLLGACAGATGARRENDPGRSPGWAGWSSLLQGAATRAEAQFIDARRLQPDDPIGLFGLAALAFEQGETETALEATLTLLELPAGRPGDAWAPLLAAAAATRLGVLLAEAAEPRAFEDRLLRLRTGGLPWRARLLIEEANDAIARRRGDGRLLRQTDLRQGCVQQIVWTGTAGRLPTLDLTGAPAVPLPTPQRLQASGCFLTVPEREGLPGVRLLQAGLSTTANRLLVVLDYGGPALIEMDGRPLATHGSDQAFGPRATAVTVDAPPGRHTLQLRLGSYGGPAQLRAFVLDPAPPETAPPKPSGEAQSAVLELAQGLIAEATGETEPMLNAASRLRMRRRFGVGLAAAATFLASDPSRPAALARDEAESLNRAAVAVDARLARVFLTLSRTELARDRSLEAAELSRQALAATPGFWPAATTQVEALRARGLERHADQVLAQMMARLHRAEGACELVLLAHQRAQIRYQTEQERILTERLRRCDARSTVPLDWLRRRGDASRTAAELEARLDFVHERNAARAELAAARLALGDAAAAVRELQALVQLAPRDSSLRLRLADAERAAGQPERARELLAETVGKFPGQSQVRQAARVLGLPLPLDDFRLDARAVIREYRESGSDYEAPAVLVLDRTVARVLDDGTQVILTHNIVNVKTKDGIARWGEVEVPDNAEILSLRTHKADGRVREPEEIAGKEAISAPDLAAGDFVEWETVEYREPEGSFAPGFVGDRFYFQSLELPLHLSEYVLLAPASLALDFDRRAGAPAPEVSDGPAGTKRYRFVAQKMAQLFAEPASVAHIEWIPSVRATSGVTVERWSRMLADGLYGVARRSPALNALARKVVLQVDPAGNRWPAAIVRWTKENIEAEAGLAESATSSIARGRGSRPAVIVALARALGLDAQLVLARPLSEVPADRAPVSQELDDFSEVLVRFAGRGPNAPPVFVDPRWKHAPLGYLPPALDGARCLVLGSDRLETARSQSTESRVVRMTLRLEPGGAGSGEVREQLRGWPAVEWAAVHERLRGDEGKLRQEFEQRWLNHHFPGARLDVLSITINNDREGEAELRYSFSSAALASRQGEELRLLPGFFRSQPGRRFATEGARRTALLVGSDPNLDLEAELLLPGGASVVDPGREGEVATGPGKVLRFSEQRKTVADARPGGAGVRVRIRRQAALPLVRIDPADYPTVAGELRRVDPLEQGEIRIRLTGERLSQGSR
jgi:tetratricopeptide (TPR) repeat protein